MNQKITKTLCNCCGKELTRNQKKDTNKIKKYFLKYGDKYALYQGHPVSFYSKEDALYASQIYGKEDSMNYQIQAQEIQPDFDPTIFPDLEMERF